MKYYNYIFSEEPAYRFARHSVFWLMVFLYHFIRISLLYPPSLISTNLMSILSGAMIWGVLLNMINSYFLVYYLIPKFFNKKRYFLFITQILLLYFVLFFLGMLNLFLNKQMAAAIGTSSQSFDIFLRATVIRILGNPPLIVGSLLSLKTIKNWYLKQKENEVLVRENANAEIQLLKAQVHPHFLFNTLNNIYSFSLTKSPQAQVLVEKLAGTLQYMIAECDVALVHLEMELKMIMDYIELEKVRYGNRLQMKIDVTGECRNKLIAPLLLIPFVENCFKHGTSKMLEEPWIEMKITIEDNMLFFALVNSKPEKNVYDEKKGIGLNNVRKRLDILYQKRYSLEISNSVNYFSVTLNLPLNTCTTGTGHMLNESGFKRS